jgi:hypothetical protein
MVSTQRFLQIAEIKQDTLILKDGSLRAVILVSSVNFALKSEDEQKALVYGYVSMLNTLEYPVQILIQSRKMNIDSYLKDLEEKAKIQTNELLKVHTEDYINFIKEIVVLGNIMAKRFYITVPYNVGGEARPGFFKRTVAVFSPAKVISLKEATFLRYKEKLQKRVDNVIAGLENLNLPAVRLDTQALIELFYASYNLELVDRQKLGSLEELQVEMT